MIKKLFVLMLSITFSLHGQEFNPGLLKDLSNEQKKEIEKILNQKNIYSEGQGNLEGDVLNPQESLQEVIICSKIITK